VGSTPKYFDGITADADGPGGGQTNGLNPGFDLTICAKSLLRSGGGGALAKLPNIARGVTWKTTAEIPK
jgi:hypothetical protein